MNELHFNQLTKFAYEQGRCLSKVKKELSERNPIGLAPCTISERIKFFEATDALCVREREHLLSLPYTEALIELGIR